MPASGARLGGANLPYDGNREEVLKYVSPAVAGFTASAAWFGNKNDAWDASLRYAGEFSGIRLAGGVGYRVEDSIVVGDKTKTFAGSASVMHVLSGLFLNGSYGKLTGLAWLGDGVLFETSGLEKLIGSADDIAAKIDELRWGSAVLGLHQRRIGIGRAQQQKCACQHDYDG